MGGGGLGWGGGGGGGGGGEGSEIFKKGGGSMVQGQVFLKGQLTLFLFHFSKVYHFDI